jgi:hypothetical protein
VPAGRLCCSAMVCARDLTRRAQAQRRAAQSRVALLCCVVSLGAVATSMLSRPALAVKSWRRGGSAQLLVSYLTATYGG